MMPVRFDHFAGQSFVRKSGNLRVRALAAFLLAVLLPTAQARAQQPVEPVAVSPINGETYYLINQSTGFQVDLNNNSTTNGATVLQQPRSFTNLSQRWALTQAGAFWKLSNMQNGLCLDSSISGGVASTVQNACTSASTQQWTLQATSNGYYTLTNSSSGLALDLSGAAVGAALNQTALTSTPTQSQQWLLRPVFFRGVDNALLEKQEADKVANGVPWWTDADVTQDVLLILKNHGVNMIRVRPTSIPPYNTLTSTTCSGNGCYAETDAQDINLAKRAKNLGMSVELSFYFDGGSSAAIPAAYSADTQTQVQNAVYAYVKAEIEAYRSAGAMPDMVAIGNEVDTGLLGSFASPRTSFSAFAAVEQQGMQAVADASADTSIGNALPTPIRCIHITPSYNLSSFFTNANNDAIPYDAMCQSYYPIYHGPLTAAQAATSNPGNKPIEQSVLNAAATAIAKPIFIIETGEHYESGFDANDTWYAATPAGQRQFLIDLNSVLKAVPNNLGMGFEYWDATGVNDYINGGGYSNGDGKIDAIYNWNGLTLFDNADTQGYANASLINYSAVLPGMDALGGKLDPTLFYKLVNQSTGQILEVNRASTAAGAALDTTTDTGVISQHQQWIIKSNGDGYFQIANANAGSTNGVLDSTGSTAAASSVVQNPAASGVTGQEWNIVTAGNGTFALVNKASSLVLDAPSSTMIEQTAPTSITADWVVPAATTQLWQIVPVHISAFSSPSELVFDSGTPSTLKFGGSPGGITVDVADSAGATIGSPQESITLTLTGPNAYSNVSTTTSSNGVATFDLSSLSLATAGTYTLTASSSGLTSASVTLTVAQAPLAATPSFSPAGGTYIGPQTVTIADSTSGATIYYTTNGTVPTTASSVYSGPVTVSLAETLQAIATASGYQQSAVATAAYTINPPPGFAITGTAVTLAPGAMTGNTSIITVTPSGGFTGTIALSCTITPIAKSDPATCGLPAAMTISASTVQTTLLTVNTTAVRLAAGATRNVSLIEICGGILPCILIIGISGRRKKWQSLLALLALIVVSAGVTSCAGSGNGTAGANSGTTPGAYTVTVTGVSGAITQTGTFSLTVQ